MKNTFTLIIILTFVLQAILASGKTYQVNSPDGRVELSVEVNEEIHYSIMFLDNKIIHPSPISLEIEGGNRMGINPKVKKSNTIEINETIIPVVAEKRSIVFDHCNELTIDFKGDYSLVFRVYNDGVAYRWAINRDGEIIVKYEQSTFILSASDSVYFPEEESFLTHSERKYPLLALKDITNEQMSCMPVLVKRADNIRIAITEADLPKRATPRSAPPLPRPLTSPDSSEPFLNIGLREKIEKSLFNLKILVRMLYFGHPNQALHQDSAT